MLRLRWLFVFALAFPALSACGGPGFTVTDLGTTYNTPPGSFGKKTSVVAIVNPKYNAGSIVRVATGAPREGVAVAMAATTFATSTDMSGLAVLEGVPTGSQILSVAGQSLPINIVNEYELYDVVVSWNNGLALYVTDPIRYPVVHNVMILAPGDDIGAKAVYDNTVVVLNEGEYPGNIELRAANLLIFGAWSASKGPLTKITGDVTVRGGGNRMRGVEVTGKIISNANEFSAAFNKFGGAEITGNSVTLIRNEFAAGSNAKVPSSNALLVDNLNIP